MTEQPRRRPIKLANNGVAALLGMNDPNKSSDIGLRADLTLASIKADLNNLGWPARTPDGDRKADRAPDPETAPAVDYADPTGEQAAQRDRLSEDMLRWQDAHARIKHELKVLHGIQQRHIPTITAEPQCSRPDCDDLVEREGDKFRGCILVAGIWCVKPGAKDDPVCRKHRGTRERLARAEEQARAEYEEQQARLAS